MISTSIIDSLLVYEANNNLINIGDYIQSLAARQYLNDSVQFISREKLLDYYGAKTRLIMNGWFLHDLNNWPPSENIIPMFIAFHVNSGAVSILNNAQSIEYLKKHQPIGCRDKYTVKLLSERGIKSYFSGCLTLTLGETYSSESKDGQIYFVDPYMPKLFGVSFYKKIYLTFTVIQNAITIIKICKKMHGGRLSLRKYYKASCFFKTYRSFFSKSIMLKAEYLTHMYHPDYFHSEDQKFSEAENLIHKFSRAKLVVTSRIHCALPCLAIETPVIYTDDCLKNEISSCRLDGLLELFNILYIKDGKIVGKDINDDVNFVNQNTKIRNKTIYKKIKKDIIKVLNDNSFFLRK